MSTPFFGPVLGVSAAVLLLAASPVRAGEGKVSPARADCPRAQEYITTMEFLNTSPDWALGEDGMRRVARRVAFHCPGSAARFIRVGRLLGEVGTSGADAVKTAIRYAELDDGRAERFIALFKNLYLEEKLDLDIATSANLANELSADFTGTLPGVEREFARLSEFCSTDEGLGQSRPQCARFAAHVVAGAKDSPPASLSAGRRRMTFWPPSPVRSCPRLRRRRWPLKWSPRARPEPRASSRRTATPFHPRD